MFGFWISVAVIATALVVFELYGRLLKRRGHLVGIVELVPYIKGVAAMGLDGSRMRVERPGSAYFIDFEKVAPPSGPEGLRMVVYEKACSAQEFLRVKEALSAVNAGFTTRNDASRGACVVVNIGMDGVFGARAARAVLAQAWGIGLDEKVRVWNKGRFLWQPEKVKLVS